MADILGEARRDAAHCGHISDPQPPIVRYGAPVEAIDAILEDRLRDARDRRMRALPRSFPVLLAGVASWPVRRQAVQASEVEQRAYETWFERNTEFFRAFFGDNLLSIIEHVDEPYLHLHFFAAAQPDPVTRLYTLETIWPPMAQEGAKRRSNSKRKEQRKAFRGEARRIQRAYYENVGAPSGLTRFGPRRQRLTREEWRKQLEQAKALAEVAERLAKREAALELEIRQAAESLAKVMIESRVAAITSTTNRKLADAKDFCQRLIERNRSLEDGLRVSEQEVERLRSVLLDIGIDPDVSSGLTAR